MDKLEIYLVGGAVRDKLLHLPVKEQDWVVVGSTPEELIAGGFLQVGKDFPVFLHPETKEEYALARTERKIAPGYYGFQCNFDPSVTLEEDLSRRDFTINAIAEDLDGKIIDPFHGQQDLAAKIFRHISPAFSEDPVRILRLARFAARFAPMGFTIALETIALLREMVARGEVDALVPERVWQEMERSLKETDPTQFFMVLRTCDALKQLWPALDKLWGVPEKIEYHPEANVGIHVMMVLKKATELSSDPITRFAALCHDLGKGETPSNEWPSHKEHEERGVPLIEEFCQKYRVPNAYRDLAKMVSRYHINCHRAFELKASTILKMLERLDAFRKPERFEQFLIACQADFNGRIGSEEKAYPQAERLRAALHAAKNVDIKSLVDQNLMGEILKEKIHEERVRAIKEQLS